MLCCPIRSPFSGSRRFPGGVKSSRNSDAKCNIPNRRRAADSMLTKRATRSLWNNRSVSGQRNDRITSSEYYALRKTCSFFLAPAALIPAQFRRREADIAIQDHLQRRASIQGRLRAPLAQYRCQAHRHADGGADAHTLYGVPRRGSGDAADRGARARRGGDSPHVVSGIPFARDFALLPVDRLALRRSQMRMEIARRPVGQGERIETNVQFPFAFGLPGGLADGDRPVHETAGGNNDPPT